MEELSYVFTQCFVSCVHGAHFHLAGRKHFAFSPPLWISMFFFLRNSSPLFSITRPSSFSVIHVSVNIKNNAKKDTTLLLVLLSNSRGGHEISFQIKPWVAFGLPYLFIELFYIGMPVVRTDGQAGGPCTTTWLPNFLGWVDYQISLAKGLCPRAALRAAHGAPLKTTTQFFEAQLVWDRRIQN